MIVFVFADPYFCPGNLLLSVFFVLVDLLLNKSEIVELWWNIQHFLLGYCTVSTVCVCVCVCRHRVRGSGPETLPRLWMMSLNDWQSLISCAVVERAVRICPTQHPPLYSQCHIGGLSWRDKVPPSATEPTRVSVLVTGHFHSGLSEVQRVSQRSLAQNCYW